MTKTSDDKRKETQMPATSPAATPLVTRVRNGREKIAAAKKQGVDTSVWEGHLAALERQLDTQTVEAIERIRTLLPLIQEGARRGYARQLERTPAEIIRAASKRVAGAPPGSDEAALLAALGADAQPVIAFGAAVRFYRSAVLLLDACGVDTLLDRAALDACLHYGPDEGFGSDQNAPVAQTLGEGVG